MKALSNFNILVVDDHPFYRHGMSNLFYSIPNILICNEAENGMQALKLLKCMIGNMKLDKQMVM